MRDRQTDGQTTTTTIARPLIKYGWLKITMNGVTKQLQQVTTANWNQEVCLRAHLHADLMESNRLMTRSLVASDQESLRSSLPALSLCHDCLPCNPATANTPHSQRILILTCLQ